MRGHGPTRSTYLLADKPRMYSPPNENEHAALLPAELSTPNERCPVARAVIIRHVRLCFGALLNIL